MLESVHISVAWSLQPPQSELTSKFDGETSNEIERVQKLVSRDDDEKDLETSRRIEPEVDTGSEWAMDVGVESVKVKMGNVIHVIPLERNRDGGGRGFLG